MLAIGRGKGLNQVSPIPSAWCEYLQMPMAQTFILIKNIETKERSIEDISSCFDTTESHAVYPKMDRFGLN